MERCKACGKDGYLEGPCNCITRKCKRCNRFRRHKDNNSLCFDCENRLPPQILSGNNAVDKLIKKAKLSNKYTIEFVPYEQFTDITYLGKGGFSTVYKATWPNGPLSWVGPNHYNRHLNNKEVVLKNIDDSNDAVPGFLNEVENYFKCMNAEKFRQHLHNYLSKNFKDLPSKMKGEILSKIIKGLEAIYSANLIHRDFHSGRAQSQNSEH
ncbi:7915_t:CDS:2 [Cetraspora pellucida]|uniref:7915_t:CDS:1 n=1 Tax=Cetraspora pellucida TaxID=1433469 RepID=A0A9N8VST9_9GLOM|nr:7915_t:CDS:2 [Cetraspora pellucida]